MLLFFRTCMHKKISDGFLPEKPCRNGRRLPATNRQGKIMQIT